MSASRRTATNQQGSSAAPQSAQASKRPFFQASKHGTEIGPSYFPTLSGGTVSNKPEPLPATGYLRRVRLQTKLSGGGATTAGVGSADFPFNLFNLVRLQQPNGAPILELSGYHLLLADTYGGYAGCPDPRVDPDYSASGSNPVIEPYIPIEIDATGVGSLSNLSNASAFRLTVVYEADGTIWTTVPNPIPAVETDVYCDFWTLPDAADEQGIPNDTEPPGYGTIQMWTQLENNSFNSGNRASLERMGNQLRTIIVVARSNAGARQDNIFPDPYQLRWDDVLLREESARSLRKKMREYTNDLVARDTGVYTFPFNTGVGRFVGGNGFVSYLPTVTGTRFELSGSNAGGAGNLTWLVNDVTSTPQTGIQRATVGGGLGYNPPAPAPAAGTMG